MYKTLSALQTEQVNLRGEIRLLRGIIVDHVNLGSIPPDSTARTDLITSQAYHKSDSNDTATNVVSINFLTSVNR